MGAGKLSPLIARQEIASAVKRIAALIRRDYADRCPLLLGVLKGSFVFLADLVREIDIPLTVDFIRARSYEGATSTGTVAATSLPEVSLSGRHVLLVEDIVDTGITASHLIHQLQAYGPASLKLCALLDKPTARVVPVQIDYLGLTVSEGFVVGYGLDFSQRYRYLPDIYCLKEPQSGP
jgi:hypoxanthine phosphoribosyltransferase